MEQPVAEDARDPEGEHRPPIGSQRKAWADQSPLGGRPPNKPILPWPWIGRGAPTLPHKGLGGALQRHFTGPFKPFKRLEKVFRSKA